MAIDDTKTNPNDNLTQDRAKRIDHLHRDDSITLFGNFDLAVQVFLILVAGAMLALAELNRSVINFSLS